MNLDIMVAIREDLTLPTGYHKSILYALASRGDKAYPNQSQLMRDAGIGSRNTLIKTISDLEKLGWLKITKSRHKNNKYWKSNTHKFGVQVYCIECHKIKDKELRMRRRLYGPTVIKTQKVCNICNVLKPISQFGIRRDAADGRLSYCKPCWVIYIKKAQLKSKK